MREEPNDLSGRLKAARERSGLSARGLSRLAGLSDGYIHLVESRKRDNPAVSIVVSVTNILGVGLEWLVLGKGRIPSYETIREAVEKAQEQVST